MTRARNHNAMGFGEHLEELRHRLIVALLGLVPILVVAFVFGTYLLEFLMRPVQDALRSRELPPILQATGVLETFGSYMRVSLTAAILIGSPWLLWQLWMFVAPGLYARERRFAYVLAPLSVLMTFLGAFFLYTVMLPVSLAFLIGFGAQVGELPVDKIPAPQGLVLPNAPILPADPADRGKGDMWINRRLMELRIYIGEDANGEPLIAGAPLRRSTGIVQQYRISEYTKLVFSLAIAFIIGFQTPVVVLLLGWAGVIDEHFLDGKRKYIVLACVVVAAILTPTTDPLSLAVLAAPLYLLFELGVLLMRILPAHRVAGEGPDAGEL